MDIRHLSADFAASPQIDPSDAPAIAEAGFKTVICNRPDPEVPPHLQAEAVQAAVEAAGMAFIYNPVSHAGITPEMLDVQDRALIEGPSVFAYCNSGTRSTVVWLFQRARAGEDVDSLLGAAQSAGYALQGLRPQMIALQQG